MFRPPGRGDIASTRGLRIGVAAGVVVALGLVLVPFIASRSGGTTFQSAPTSQSPSASQPATASQPASDRAAEELEQSEAIGSAGDAEGADGGYAPSAQTAPAAPAPPDEEWRRLLDTITAPRTELPEGAGDADAGAGSSGSGGLAGGGGDGDLAAASAPADGSAPVDGSAPDSQEKSPDGNDEQSLIDRKAHAEDRGATPLTETAVDLGLTWLAAHQDADGLWDSIDFQKHCPPDDKCKHPAVHRTDSSINVGLTGLCLLAFVGAGNTAERGPYKETVSRAVNAILTAQRENGAFGPDDLMSGYNDPLATFALAEYLAQSPDDSRVREALGYAAERLAAVQQPFGGWDYYPAPLTQRNDTSITAWAVQALVACEAVGIRVPRQVLLRAALHTARATEPDGRVWYADAGEGFRLGRDLQAQYRYGPAMTAAGMLCATLLGWRVDSPVVRQQQALLLRDLPSSARVRGRDPSQLHSEYYWYYGTAAIFQLGGDAWDDWNGDLRDAILPLQDRSTLKMTAAKRAAAKGTPLADAEEIRRHAFGSWAAFGPNWGKWGRMGGRVYVTAISVLTLETYYRHTPAYLAKPLALESEDWAAFLASADVSARRLAVRCLSGARYEVGEPVLVTTLRDSDAGAARLAAEALLAIGSPVGRGVLIAQHELAPDWAKAKLEEAIKRADALRALPAAEGVVAQKDAALGLYTLQMPRAFLGMRLRVADSVSGAAPAGERIAAGDDASAPASQRAGDVPASGELRVLRRYSGHSRVLAEWVGTVDGPAVGTRVVEVRAGG